MLQEEQSNRLAKIIQNGVPLVERPFAQIALDLGCQEEDVLAQLHRWHDEKLLREISAVLEGSVLGYDSALVAGAVPSERIDEVAEIVNAHPTVTHNYLRNHAYNLWFTIAVPHEMGLERTLEILAAEAGVEAFLPLRRTHTFKIGVNFDLKNRANSTERVELSSPQARNFSTAEIRILRSLQIPIDYVAEPFAALAANAGVSQSAFLDFAKANLGGAVRKYVATFHHRRLGVRGNGMAVYRVSETNIEAKGHDLAACPEVSHCYARNTIEGFPYRLYSMLHGPDEETCSKIAADLAARIGAEDFLVLFSSREFKKCRLRYFLPELEAWWQARAGTFPSDTLKKHRDQNTMRFNLLVRKTSMRFNLLERRG